MIVSLCGWLEESQLRYLALAQTVLFATIALVVAGAFIPKLGERLATRRGALCVLGAVFLALVASRWPTFFVFHHLNPDEAQMIAQSISVPSDPIPWHGFDGLSSGPLNTYLLVLPELIGLHSTFMTARMIAVLLEFGALASLYLALAACFDRATARLAILPPLVFWCVTTQEDFVHYSSEQFPIFLTSAGFALVATGRRSGYRFPLVVATGILVGMLPFAKLQAIYLALTIAALAIAAYLGATAMPRNERLKRVAAFIGGTCIAPAVILTIAALGGSFDDFRRSYIETSLAYLEHQPDLYGFLTATPDFSPYFVPMTIVALLGIVAAAIVYRRLPNTWINAYAASLLLVLASIYTIYVPGRSSPHYLLFAVVPIAGAAGAALAIIGRALSSATEGTRRGALATVFVAVTLISQNAILRPSYPWIGNDFGAYMWPGSFDPLVEVIDKKLHPGDRLAIWGWRAEYFVHSQLRMGTRDAVAGYQYMDVGNPNREYYRARYVSDFARLKPEGFLDAGSESWDQEPGDKAGYKSFPELAKLVDADYVPAGGWNRYHFFIRRDLADRKT